MVVGSTPWTMTTVSLSLARLRVKPKPNKTTSKTTHVKNPFFIHHSSFLFIFYLCLRFFTTPNSLLTTPGFYSCVNLGSRMSRSHFPSQLIPNTTSIIATPGKVANHQDVTIYTRPSASIPPQVGVGG